jgi:TolB-like protein
MENSRFHCIAARVRGGARLLFSGPAGRIDSIAVLPFVNAANDPSLDLQVDGLTEELINSLTQAPDLKVIARATVVRYKSKAADPE